MTTSKAILLVEDNEDDVFLMRRALKGAGITNPLDVVEDGQQAVDFLIAAQADPGKSLPAIIFLDIKIPLRDGLDVLAWIRSKPELEPIVVIILSSSNQPSDLRTAYRLGANSYVVKPPTTAQLLDLAKAFKGYWLEFNQYEEAHA